MNVEELEARIDQRVDWISLLNADGLKALIGNLAGHLEDCTSMSLGDEDTAVVVRKVVPSLLRVFAKISQRLTDIDSELTWSERQDLVPLINNLTSSFHHLAEKSLRYTDALTRFESMSPSSSVN